MLEFKTKGSGFESWSDHIFFFSLFVSPMTIKLRKYKMYYQLIIFIGECKNYEMLLCIKYLNRKGIEVRDGSSKKKKNKKKTRSNFLVEEELILTSFGNIKILIF